MSHTDSIVHAKLLTPPVQHHALEGIVIGGSYNPDEGTVDVLLGDTGAVENDGQSGQVILKGLPLTVHAIGDQQGPLGDERCILVQRWSGYAVQLEHGPDDSPAAPSGERWIVPPGTNTSLKFQKNKVTLSASEIDLIAASLAKIIAPQFTVQASTSVLLDTPVVEISGTSITSTTGDPISFIGGGGTAYSIVRTVDLLTLIGEINSHVHTNGGGGLNTGTPTVPFTPVPGSSQFLAS